MTKGKTFKREVAIVLLVWFAYLVEAKDANLVEILVWPVFTYSALAFGIDWFGKSGGLYGSRSSQTPYRGRTQGSSQHTNRQEQQPDHWHIDRFGGPKGD